VWLIGSRRREGDVLILMIGVLGGCLHDELFVRIKDACCENFRWGSTSS
jgi:hypothetical protein